MVWQNGEINYDPSNAIGADNPVICAISSMDAQMETVQAARYMTERLLRMAKQAAQCYKYGFKVANNYDHTVDLDT